MTDAEALIHELLEACRAQHRAIDLLLALIVYHDPTFRPWQSPAWPAVKQSYTAICKAEAFAYRSLEGDQ